MKARLLLTTLFLMCVSQLWAYDFEAKNEDGVTFYFNILSKSECELAKADNSERIKIPHSVFYKGNELIITQIGARAFSKCFDLDELIMPSSIKSVKQDAFWIPFSESGEKNEIQKIEFENIESICSIEYEVLGDSYTCGLLEKAKHLYVNGQEVKDITIPNTTKKINAYSFANCKSINSVVMDDSVIEIGDYAFIRCSNIMSVKFSNSIETIGSGAFYGCVNLPSIIIPNKVAQINRVSS